MINNPIQSSIDAKMRVNGGFFIFSSFLSPFSWYYQFFYVLLRQDCNININCRVYFADPYCLILLMIWTF